MIRIRNPDPESGSAIRKNVGSGSVSGSALNQCGSETLQSMVQLNYSSSSKIAIFLNCDFQLSKLKKKPPTLYRENSAVENMKISLLFVGFFALLHRLNGFQIQFLILIKNRAFAHNWLKYRTFLGIAWSILQFF